MIALTASCRSGRRTDPIVSTASRVVDSLEVREIRVRVGRAGHRARTLRPWTSLRDPRTERAATAGDHLAPLRVSVPKLLQVVQAMWFTVAFGHGLLTECQMQSMMKRGHASAALLHARPAIADVFPPSPAARDALAPADAQRIGRRAVSPGDAVTRRHGIYEWHWL